MNDLHDLMEGASASSTSWHSDPQELLGEGRRRVRRRRLQVGGVVAAVVAVASVAAGVATATHGPGPSSPHGYADLDLTPLTADQVVERCTPQLRDGGDVGDLSVPASVRQRGHEQQAPRPWHTGSQVLLRSTTGGVVGCLVPERPEAMGALRMVTDTADLRPVCGGKVGIDLGGWQQVAAAADGQLQYALFRSSNGYAVYCWSQEVPHFGLQGASTVVRADTRGLARGVGVCLRTRDHQVHCGGFGRVAADDATRVVVRLPGGRRLTRPAVDGYWAITVTGTRADLTGAVRQAFEVHARRP